MREEAAGLKRCVLRYVVRDRTVCNDVLKGLRA
jgi:hypothetical protein